MRRGIKTAAALAVVLVGTMGASNSCGTTPKVVNQSGSSGSGSKAPAPAHLGGTLVLANNNESLTITAVSGFVAQGADEFTTPDPGKHFVGIKLVLANSGKTTVTGDADGEAHVTGSDNQSYDPDFSDIAGCTNFNHGSYTLAVGENVTGCVTFQLPAGVLVKKISYDPTIFGTGESGEWLVP